MKEIRIKTVQRAKIYKDYIYKDGRKNKARITETTGKDGSKSYHVSCGLCYNFTTFEEARTVTEKTLNNLYVNHDVVFIY